MTIRQCVTYRNDFWPQGQIIVFSSFAITLRPGLDKLRREETEEAEAEKIRLKQDSLRSKERHNKYCRNLFYKCVHVLSVQSEIFKREIRSRQNNSFRYLKRKSEYLANFQSNENVQKFRFGNKSKHDNLNDLRLQDIFHAKQKS
jgi:hypothetical protein